MSKFKTVKVGQWCTFTILRKDTVSGRVTNVNDDFITVDGELCSAGSSRQLDKLYKEAIVSFKIEEIETQTEED